MVNCRFRSSVLDTRVFQKPYLQSDHRLVGWKVRLKLKAERQGAQRQPRHQVAMEHLGITKWRSLEMELNDGPIGGVEEIWGTFNKALGKVQQGR